MWIDWRVKGMAGSRQSGTTCGVAGRGEGGREVRDAGVSRWLLVLHLNSGRVKGQGGWKSQPAYLTALY